MPLQSTDLQEWANAHVPADDLLFKSGYWDQIVFVRDQIHPLFVPRFDAREENPVQVISTHRSKSVLLPVYGIDIARSGKTVQLTMRYNFSNWGVSIDTGYYRVPDIFGDVLPRPMLQMPKGDTVDQDSYETNAVYYYEGFPVERCFGSYIDSQKQFSFHLPNRYELYTFCRLFTAWLRP